MSLKNLLKEREWEYFKYEDIFIIKKGKRLANREQQNGNIPYISSSYLNNGIDNYISNGYTDENCLSFACYGSIGYVFYHPYKSWISDNCNVFYLKNKTLNEDIAMFLIPILEIEKYRFSYGMTAKTQRIKNFKIKLPTTNNKVDWNIIENYIQNIKKKIKLPTPESILKEKMKINIKTWKKFAVGEIFNIKKSYPIHAIELKYFKKGNLPYITRTGLNNGVEKFVSNEKQFESYINQEDCISIAGEGLVAFYQFKKFITGNNIILLYNKNLNKYNALFLITILTKELKIKFNYGIGINKQRINNLTIKLPSKNNQPDWSFMENYIKTLPYSSSL